MLSIFSCTFWPSIHLLWKNVYLFRSSRHFFLKIYWLIDWLIAMLVLCFCARAFSSCGKWGPLFIAVCGPLTIAASLVAEHRLQTRRISSCGSQAQLLHGMWDPPRPGLEPMSPALAGRFSTTVPPGKPPPDIFWLGCLLLLFLSLLRCMSCLYSLEINPMSFASSANIFSHSVGCSSCCYCFLCCAKL